MPVGDRLIGLTVKVINCTVFEFQILCLLTTAVVEDDHVRTVVKSPSYFHIQTSKPFFFTPILVHATPGQLPPGKVVCHYSKPSSLPDSSLKERGSKRRYLLE